METLTIESRFCGPPGMANGGYAVGRIAAFGTGTMRVRLQAPTPLDRPLEVALLGAGRVEVRDGDTMIARAEPAELDLVPPRPPAFEAAVAAAARSVVHRCHPFPGCFVCGTDRVEGEGLRLFAGPTGVEDVVATPFVPYGGLAGEDGFVRREFVYAALDCPGYLAADDTGIPMLTGEMTVRVDRAPRADERCIAVGWKIAASGRKAEIGTAVFLEDGSLAGLARSIWLDARPG